MEWWLHSAGEDPRIQGSLADMGAAFDWLLTSPVEEAWVEQAALGVLGQIVRSKSPVAAIREADHNRRIGYTMELQQRDFDRMRSATLKDLRRAVAEHLPHRNEDHRCCVVTSPAIAAREGLRDWTEFPVG
jgi:Zn-dependent M16 (insulinase) family peptidase